MVGCPPCCTLPLLSFLLPLSPPLSLYQRAISRSRFFHETCDRFSASLLLAEEWRMAPMREGRFLPMSRRCCRSGLLQAVDKDSGHSHNEALQFTTLPLQSVITSVSRGWYTLDRNGIRAGFLLWGLGREGRGSAQCARAIIALSRVLPKNRSPLRNQR